MQKLLTLTASFALLTGCASMTGRSIQQSDPVAEVFARIHSSVVTLRTESVMPVPGSMGIPVMTQGLGTGTLIDESGLILTAAHVVQTAESLQAEFFDGSSVEARVISSDPLTDLALVQLTGPIPEGMAVAPMGDSDYVPVGARVIVIGAPLGISHTLTVGHLSARRIAPSMLGGESRIEVLQTDAAINPGNSGGPMLNSAGEVVGVVSYIATESGGSQGLGFAVSMATVRERLLERPRLWSGLTYLFVSGRLAQALHFPAGRPGLLVQHVASGSPGEALGLKGGDIEIHVAGETLLLGGDVILEVLDVSVESIDDLERVRDTLVAMDEGDDFVVKILRDGRRKTLRKRYGDL